MIFRAQTGLTPKYDFCISKIERVMTIFVGQGTTKSCYLKIFKSQYLSEFLTYGPDFLYVIKGCTITMYNSVLNFSYIQAFLMWNIA